MSEMSGTLRSYLHIDIDTKSRIPEWIDGPRRDQKFYRTVHLVFMTAFMA